MNSNAGAMTDIVKKQLIMKVVTSATTAYDECFSKK